MRFEPGIWLHRNDEYGQVQDIFFEYDEWICFEHFIEQYSFCIPKKTKYKIDKEKSIYPIENGFIAPVLTQLDKQQYKNDGCDDQFLF